jgi:Na+/H+ antiporter NhaA
LAFESPEVVDDAKLGILAASAIAATLGTIVLSRAKPAVEIETETPEDEAAEAPE